MTKAVFRNYGLLAPASKTQLPAAQRSPWPRRQAKVRREEKTVRPDFREALADLLAQYADVPLDEVISDLEMQLDALRDDLKSKAADGDA